MSDSLAGLRQALSPKGGLQRIPLPLESYQHPSIPLSAKRLVNLYSERAPDDARSKAALIPTFGLSPYRLLGTGPIHCINGDLPALVYVVSGTHFYRIRNNGDLTQTITDLGDVGTAQGTTNYYRMVTIAVGVNAAVVCVPPNAFTCGHENTDALNQIGGTWPVDGARSVAYHDGYFVYTAFLSFDTFFISKLLDPLDYDAFDFASSDAVPNFLTRVVSWRGDLWMLGNAGLEVWYNSGPDSSLDFPFRRRSGTVIAQAIASPKSFAAGDGSIFWVGPDNFVYRSTGYTPTRISGHAEESIIENAIDPLGSVGAYAVLSAFFFAHNGHSFYCLNLPTITLVYDCATKLWHYRASGADGTGRWRAQHTTLAGFQIFGDMTTGQLWALDPNSDHEGTDPPLTRIMTLPPLWGGTHRGYCSRVEIEADVPPNGSMTLTWSDNGGKTFTGGPRAMTVSRDPNRPGRLFTTRLGSYHERVYQAKTNTKTTIYAFDADISEPGASNGSIA